MRALALATLLLTACSSTTTTRPPSDLSQAAPDLAPGADDLGSDDLATDDLATAADDLAPPPDLAPSPDLATTFAVGGTLSGLAGGPTRVLAHKGGDNLMLSGNGP